MTAELPPVYRPIESRQAGLPAWVLVLAGLLLAAAAVYLLTNLTPPPQPGQAAGGSGATAGASPDQGAPIDVAAAQALISEAQCQQCHGEDLGGQAVFPSLLGVSEGPVSDNLQQLGQEHPDDWANLWIAGDSPEVEGIDRRGMPAFGEQLSDEEIELIVEYLKSL